MGRYLITCTECGASREVGITKGVMGDLIDWLDNRPDGEQIVSGRPRLDGEFGWQCLCGNNDLMTSQEKQFIGKNTDPEPSTIKKIMDDIKTEVPKFKMERV